MQGDSSPDRNGGLTERTQEKGRILRFNLQECDYQNDQHISMH